MNRRILAVAFATLSALGCQKKSDAPPPAPAPVVSAEPVEALDPSGGGVPTVQDFEKQADDEINPQNLEQELDRLEREIGK